MRAGPRISHAVRLLIVCLRKNPLICLAAGLDTRDSVERSVAGRYSLTHGDRLLTQLVTKSGLSLDAHSNPNPLPPDRAAVS